MKNRDEILAFMQSKTLMTISSLNEKGTPQAAVVGVGVTDDFRLVFGTSNTSRKYKSITARPSVAAVIGWDGPETVQYEGEARELKGVEADELSELYFAHNPMARKFKDNPDQAYFVVQPTWLRYTNLASHPWDITELSF